MVPISIYGGTGFVGGVYHKIFPTTIVQPKDDLSPQTSEILYLISTTDNYNIYTNPLLDITVNETLVIKALEEIKKKFGSMTTFNFVSSWFCYGDVPLPAKEDACCNPKGFYSITKRAAEQLVISYCETFGLHWRILRLANVLGIEDNHVSAKKNALQFLIQKIINDEPIQLYHGGDFVRDYIDVRDVAFAINLILNKGDINEIYNVSNGKPLIFKDLIIDAVHIAGKQPQIENVNPSEFHKIIQVKDMWLDNTKIRELGYRPRYPMHNTLSRIVHDYEHANRQE